MQFYGKRPSIGETLLQHIIVFLICVVFPGVTTFMAPATWLTFERSHEKVRCTTRTCVFFVVPFKTQAITEVTNVSERKLAGSTQRERRFGRTTDKTIHVDGEGFLKIHGVGDQVVEVNVSPASLEVVVAKCNRFLISTELGSTTIFAIANWKFGAIMGGILTSFTALYVVGYSIEAMKWLLARIKNVFVSSRSSSSTQS
jgi:hypothetical protein